MGGPADLAHAGTGFQERDFAGGQAAVMDELLAQAAARPAAGEKRFVTVEGFVADLAIPGFNPQQHRLPRSAAFSDTHATEYSEAIGGKTRSWTGSDQVPFLLAEQRGGWSLMIFCARATRGLERPSLDARSGRSVSPHPRRKTSKLGGNMYIGDARSKGQPWPLP
jgi:hypothetical protein